MIFHILTLLHLLFYKSKSRLLLLLSMLLLFILVAYRGVNVGTDTENYYIYFTRIRSNILESGYELFWEYLNRLVVFSGGEYIHVQIVAAILTLVPIYYGARKESRLPIYSIFIFLTFYYYFYSFNIMRQSVAVSFGFLAYVFYVEKGFKYRYLKVLICILIAFLFHKSALLLLPVLLINNFIKNDKYILFYILGSLFIGVFLGGPLFQLSTMVFSEYNEISLKENLIDNFVNIALLNVAVIMVVQSVQLKDFWYRQLIVFVLLSNLMIMIPYANRIIMFVGISLIIFFPNFIVNNKLEKKAKIAVFILVTLYALFRYIRIFGGGNILPYENTLFVGL